MRYLIRHLVSWLIVLAFGTISFCGHLLAAVLLVLYPQMSVMVDERPLPQTSKQFPYLHLNPSTLSASLDPFTITTATGFLPLKTPQVDLPSDFSSLTNLIQNLPVLRQDGSTGLLAQCQLGDYIEAGALPDLTDRIDHLITKDGEPDLGAITAAFRDYAFLASAYLLEPCWEKWNKDQEGGYGLGRQSLPRCIAGPLVRTAAM